MNRIGKLFLLLSVIIQSSGCEPSSDDVKVIYRISKAYSETLISYRDASGSLVTTTYDFESPEDIWQSGMMTTQGEIVYLSAMYQDSASSVRVQILVNGKVFKEASSTHEPQKYVIVSGTVPF